MSTKRQYTSRGGLTLLELVIASSMLAIVMTSLSLVLRTARVAWDTHDNSYGAMQHAGTVATHLVRSAREARAVIELPSNGNSLAVTLVDGRQLRWTHVANGPDGLDGVVMLTDLDSGKQSPLAYGILDLSFEGYEADGVTTATKVEDIQLVNVQVTVDTPNSAANRQTVESMVWIRSW